MADAWGGAWGVAWGASWTRTATVAQQPSGGYLRGSDRRRTKREIDEARRRFGIDVPDEVIETIQEAAADQVADLETDAKKQERDLRMRLRVRQLKFEARQLEWLAAERERLINEELVRITTTMRNNETITRLMLLAAMQ